MAFVNNQGTDVSVGTTVGAGVGTMVLPVVGTAIGAGIGAAVGFVAGLFGGGKPKPFDPVAGELGVMRIALGNIPNNPGHMQKGQTENDGTLYKEFTNEEVGYWLSGNAGSATMNAVVQQYNVLNPEYAAAAHNLALMNGLEYPGGIQPSDIPLLASSLNNPAAGVINTVQSDLTSITPAGVSPLIWVAVAILGYLLFFKK